MTLTCGQLCLVVDNSWHYLTWEMHKKWRAARVAEKQAALVPSCRKQNKPGEGWEQRSCSGFNKRLSLLSSPSCLLAHSLSKTQSLKWLSLFMVSGISRKHSVYKQLKYTKIDLYRVNLIMLVRREWVAYVLEGDLLAKAALYHSLSPLLHGLGTNMANIQRYHWRRAPCEEHAESGPQRWP